MSLTTVNIPESVTSIGIFAFMGCSSLTSISIPNSVTSIQQSTFYGCTSLTSVSIPNSVTSIQQSAFYGCTSLASIYIPESVTSIIFSAFRLCYALTEVLIDENNQVYSSIDDIVYNKEQTELIFCPGGKSRKVIIPGCVTTIIPGAFSGCPNLTEIFVEGINPVYSSFDGVVYDKELRELLIYPRGKSDEFAIPDFVTSIGNSAFYQCENLRSVEIPESVSSIGELAFCRCLSLETIELPKSVTNIGAYAFYYCENLTSLEIPSGVTLIGDHAFAYCYYLSSVSIPESITSIGSEAFGKCEYLKEVYYASESPIEAERDIFSSITYDWATLYVPEAAVEKCETIDPWKRFKKIEAYAPTGIKDANADGHTIQPVMIYNLNGVFMGSDTDILSPGLYIERRGDSSRKILID